MAPTHQGPASRASFAETRDESAADVEPPAPADHCREDESRLTAFLTRKHYSLDEGWSWVVLVGTAASNMIISVMYSVGIFNFIFLEVFGKDRQTTAWLTAAQWSVFNLSCLPAVFVNKKVGPRQTAIIGALLGALGFFLAAFAEGFVFLLLSYGVLVGAGYGFVYMPCIVTVGFYFKRYRNLAFCLATSTVGLGTLSLTPVLEYCILTYGWRGCMMILSGLYLQTLVVGAIMRPQYLPDELFELVNIHTTESKPAPLNWIKTSVISLASITSSRPGLDEINERKVTNSSLYELRPGYIFPDKKCDFLISQSDGNLYFNQQSDRASEIPPAPDRVPLNKETVGAIADASDCKVPARRLAASNCKRRNVFGNKKLIILIVHYVLSCAACFIGYVHFPAYFISRGASPSDITSMMTLIGTSNVACRLLCGMLTNGVEDVVFLVYMSASGLTGITFLLCPVLSSFHVGRLMFAFGFGFYGNVLSTLVTPVTLELCSLEELSLAYGTQLFAGGISSLVGPPFAGWLFDVSGDYVLSFLLGGALYMFGTLLLMAIPIVK